MTTWPMLGSARRRARALAGDRRGVALIEFAIALPVLLILYLGSFEVEDGIACNRKVTIATRAVADLLSQNQGGSTSAAEVDGDLSAATKVLAPYPATNSVMRITEVATDNNFQTTVQWSRASDGSAYKQGSIATIPIAMRIPGTYFLYSEVTYAWTPNTGSGFMSPMTLRDSLYMLPRNSNKIDCPDC